MLVGGNPKDHKENQATIKNKVQTQGVALNEGDPILGENLEAKEEDQVDSLENVIHEINLKSIKHGNELKISPSYFIWRIKNKSFCTRRGQ